MDFLSLFHGVLTFHQKQARVGGSLIMYLVAVSVLLHEAEDESSEQKGWNIPYMH